jgi:hypothetical protein
MSFLTVRKGDYEMRANGKFYQQFLGAASVTLLLVLAGATPLGFNVARNEIRIEGILANRWAAWFRDLQITSEGSQTIIPGLLPDQLLLHDVLVTVRDLGPTLIG